MEGVFGVLVTLGLPEEDWPGLAEKLSALGEKLKSPAPKSAIAKAEADELEDVRELNIKSSGTTNAHSPVDGPLTTAKTVNLESLMIWLATNAKS
jgi:hypothetical protein